MSSSSLLSSSSLSSSFYSSHFEKLRNPYEKEIQRQDDDLRISLESAGESEKGGITEGDKINEMTDRERERLRIRKKYEEQMEKKKVLMYKKAIEEAITREKARAQKYLTFSIKYPTTFGQNMYIVGSDISLGCWNTDNAIPMTWTDGNVWKCNIIPSPGVNTLEYKYILKHGDVVEWEYGRNHIISLNDRKTFEKTKMDVWGAGN